MKGVNFHNHNSQETERMAKRRPIVSILCSVEMHKECPGTTCECGCHQPALQQVQLIGNLANRENLIGSR